MENYEEIYSHGCNKAILLSTFTVLKEKEDRPKRS